MTFGSFVDIYIADMKNRIKENTWHAKNHIIRTKILILLTEVRLNGYLADINRQANEMLDLIITQTSEREGVIEDLKSKDQLKWVQMMNNIKVSAEEIVVTEFLENPIK